MENQTAPDRNMPLRVFAYDGAEYHTQLTKANRNKPNYPVVTLVLYFGTEKHWNQPLTLHEALQVPEIFRPFVPDMKINLFEVAWLSRETVEKFKSDFRIVADYFVQIQENRDYIPRPDELTHVQETLQLLHVLTNDYRFEEILNDESEKGAVKSMCEVLDKVEKRGEKRGDSSRAVKDIKNLMKNLNLSPIQAMDALSIPADNRPEYLKLLRQ